MFPNIVLKLHPLKLRAMYYSTQILGNNSEEKRN